MTREGTTYNQLQLLEICFPSHVELEGDMQIFIVLTSAVTFNQEFALSNFSEKINMASFIDTKITSKHDYK